MTIKIRRAEPTDVQVGAKLMGTPVGVGLPHVDKLWEELLDYIDVLLGRVPAPVDSPYLGLAEVATAYYARALEIDAHIHALERERDITRGSALYKFRTGELRAFIDLARKAADLGSRRLTQEQLLAQQRLDSNL